MDLWLVFSRISRREHSDHSKFFSMDLWLGFPKNSKRHTFLPLLTTLICFRPVVVLPQHFNKAYILTTSYHSKFFDGPVVGLLQNIKKAYIRIVLAFFGCTCGWPARNIRETHILATRNATTFVFSTQTRFIANCLEQTRDVSRLEQLLHIRTISSNLKRLRIASLRPDQSPGIYSRGSNISEDSRNITGRRWQAPIDSSKLDQSWASSSNNEQTRPSSITLAHILKPARADCIEQIRSE